MGDLISRQAVLASIKNLYPDMPVMDIMRARQKWLEKYTPYFECENAIKQLPSVENKGEWIKIQSGDKDFPESIVCSKCKNENSHLDFNEHGEPIGKVFVTSKYCPNCGADMREPKGEKGTE